MLEWFLIETYFINLWLVRRDSTDAASNSSPYISKWKRLLQEFDIAFKPGDEIFLLISTKCSQMDTGYTAIEQIVTFSPDLRELSLPPIITAVHGDVIKIAFHKCRFLETLTLDREEIITIYHYMEKVVAEM
jgi:hypothetical protein